MLSQKIMLKGNTVKKFRKKLTFQLQLQLDGQLRIIRIVGKNVPTFVVPMNDRRKLKQRNLFETSEG